MAKLKEYNGRYCESEFESAFISFLEDEGWNYLPGNRIVRDSQTTVLYTDDMEQFLSKTNSDLTADEIRQIMDSVRLVGAEAETADSPNSVNQRYYGNNRLQQVVKADFIHSAIYVSAQ